MRFFLAAVLQASVAGVPEDSRVVYGGTLAPHLMDMYVHLREVDLESGITLVRNMAGVDSVLRTAEGAAAASRNPRV